MTGSHRMWDGNAYIEVEVPQSANENIMVPVVRVVVTNADRTKIVLQRRDNPSEPVRGLLEIPGGRWRAGEHPTTTAVREVAEETGLTLVSVDGVASEPIDAHRTIATINPIAVVAGVDGAFPAIHIILSGVAEGEPRSEDGHSTDVRWWSRDEVSAALQRNRDWFVPSSHAALAAFLGS